MATSDDTAARELRTAEGAIGYGLSLLRIIGEERLAYLLQTESDLTLEQAEELLTMIEAGRGAGRRSPRVAIELGDADVAAIAEFLEASGQRPDSSHGPLTVEKLAGMLLEDVALAVRRPGSWEGANMANVLSSHGYGS